jgi:hypothetical protein
VGVVSIVDGVPDAPAGGFSDGEAGHARSASSEGAGLMLDQTPVVARRAREVRDRAVRRAHDVRVLDAVRAQDHGLDAVAAGPEPRRPVGPPATRGRRREDALQRRSDAETADPLIYKLAPFISLLCAMGAFAVIPFSESSAGLWGVADVNAGILVIFALTSIGVYGISLAGWSSGSKFPLLGSVRSTAQMISYELAMTMSVIGVLILAGTTSLAGIVHAQQRFGSSSRRSSGSSSTSSRRSPKPIARRSIWSKPRPNSWAGSTPSTRACGSGCSSSPST